MDRLIYTAMTGAKHILEQQATTSHNLANTSTTGFRAQLDSFRAVPVVSDGLPTRAFVVDATVGTDFSTGALQMTGRSLDVAVQGKGWLVVQQPDGTEAYTRSGSLKLNENGVLQTQGGLNVVGDTGPITIPPDVSIAIGKDGTISSVPTTGQLNAVNVIGRLKLVNPDESNLVRGDDGLFKTKDGIPAQSDPNVAVAGGTLENSNVNVVDAMVSMISLGRAFEMQMKLLQNAESNATKADQILALS
ncbi:flagellar basal-body rod protein FlgF [Undibacterium sp.]|jgi:flagellar basal-body rod protein FlgF|uniref:flagellar basal-body rod protein FlgF n=1 Tax=Undibacterium sp. TaxID=1914977 RepID=UPI002CC04D55|nr:flagellar basal-body rod protein FlgF [Undibacterium sp.]HTD05381.1 flagellar basal-body rod protein FlgF [Undibacterium sp.]